jgi:hypothetical protein
MVVFFLLTVALSFRTGWAGAAGDGEPVKAVRDPHLVHFEICRDVPPIGFAPGQIKDWPGFITSLRSRLDDLPLGHETQFLINHLMPAMMNEDEKRVIVGQLNKLLKDREFHARLSDRVPFGEETQRLLALYRHSHTDEDLQRANRSIINDMIPETTRVSVEESKKFSKFRNMNCLTCHESWKERKPPSDLPGSEMSDIGRLEQMVAAQKLTPPPPPRAAADKVVANDEFLRQHETLKKFIVRADKRRNPAFLEAIHPEDPYTFKPLLKRLVCVDCHGKDREVDKIEHIDGKSHRIKFLYGPVEETFKETH